MIIVAGYLMVVAADRPSYLANCEAVVAEARASDGCLEFSLSADILDPSRIVVYECWESKQALEFFRGSGPSSDQAAATIAASVAEYEVASTRSLT
jgi:quinol monooxygenase YgiN